MRFALFLACSLFALAAVPARSDDFSLKNGDRVVFYGDSITDQRLYTVIAETYVATRYPSLDVTFVHSGWGGDKVSGGGGGPIDLRLDRDVIAYHPTVMTIMLGMNDGLYKPETEANDQVFFNGYRHIVEKMKSAAPGIRITAIQPSPYDDVTRAPNFPGGYNEVMISFGKWIANYAEQNGLNIADLNDPVVAMLRRANELDPVEAQKIIPDRVHPGFSGHLIMAQALVDSWHARPVVATVSLDASGAKPKVKDADHAKISDVSKSPNVSWTELDDALPLPFSAWTGGWGSGPIPLVLRSSDISQRLNDETLKVAGLKNGVYTLNIDGQKVGTFNNDELAHGVNLALLDTPMSRQAKQVYDLTVSHCDVHNNRWRTVQVPLADDNLAEVRASMDSSDQLEAALLRKRHSAAQPVTHKFELVPVS